MGDRVRLDREGDGIYRIYRGGVKVGTVVRLDDTSDGGWVARLMAPRDWRWAWAAPTRRQAVGGLVRHLEETK